MEGSSAIEFIFKKAHQQKGIGRNAEKLKGIYTSLTPEAQDDFKALSVDRQIFLLSVPVKKQARFKREGVDLYASKQEERSTWKYEGQWAQDAKRNEQRRHQHVANGGSLKHERVERNNKAK